VWKNSLDERVNVVDGRVKKHRTMKGRIVVGFVTFDMTTIFQSQATASLGVPVCSNTVAWLPD